ncbi:flagellin [Clostridium sp. MD294]|uniref:flagellin N-terminal helical domain-containing protein n=1 Tax=Clostridium sp. MD294 TaxID=97138 RepID=UPI0002CC4A46|nr:flagellin [Clostridium sp. MD294]USF30428.1 Flagellin [Clostridium sp. MD294]
MIVQHNIPALNSYNRLGTNNKNVAANLKKLSSGYKINSAADNAAGLAISEKMRAQITGLEACQQNAKDGISLVQTAEGALTEVHSMLNRMVELSTLASNGTYSDSNREKYQNEIQELQDEIDRIADSTNFNGIDLLNGNLSGGGSTGGNLVGGVIGTFTPPKMTTAAADLSGTNLKFEKETIVVDDTQVTIDWSQLSSDDKAKLNRDWTDTTVAGSKTANEEAAKILQDTINKALADAGSTSSVTVSGKNGSFSIETNTKDGTGSLLLMGNGTANSETTANGASGGIFTKMFGATADTAVEATSKVNGASGANGKFYMNINGTDYEVDMSGAGLADGATGSAVATALQNAIQATIGNYNTAVGTDDQLTAADITVNFTDDGRLEIINGTDATIGFSDKTPSDHFAEALGISSQGKALGGGLSLQIGDTADEYNRVSVSIQDCHASALGVGNINVSTESSAAAGITKIKDAIDTVSKVRAKLGATQNRLDHTLNNLETTTENLTDAESRIRDTDMAKEMMQYTKNNILVQSSQAMLAQANQLPQGVLQLLQ